MLQLIYFTYSVACVASVSARVRRESWDESKKKGMTGEAKKGGRGGEKKETLAPKPQDFFGYQGWALAAKRPDW